MWLIIGWWHHHRAALCASRSSTLQSPGSSGSRWRCRSSCQLCGTQPSAGGLDATGYVAEAPLRRSSMSSYLGDGPHLPPTSTLTSSLQRGEEETDVFVFLFFYEEKLKSVHVCVCTWACVCVSVCVRVLTIYLSFGAKSWKTPEQANERAGSKEICERHMHWIIWSLIRARKQEDREPIRTEDYTILPPDLADIILHGRYWRA